MDLNIFNPVGVTLFYAIIASFVLGMIHGITPDEHTWPITFSYAIGNFSTKKGAEAGFIFSLGFTIQRALMAEAFYVIIAYNFSGIRNFLSSNIFFSSLYFLIGFVMGVAGYYVKYGGYYPHLKLNHIIGGKGKFRHKHADFYARNVSNKMAMIHGLIAGFGMGAFALIIFTVIVPEMPNIYLGFLPGAVFGVGTMVMQILFGAAFGTAMRLKKLSRAAIQFLARYMSSFVLLYGGMAFMLAGILSLAFPTLLSLGLPTGIGVYNLDNINLGFILVITTVGIMGLLSYVNGIRHIRNKSYGV